MTGVVSYNIHEVIWSLLFVYLPLIYFIIRGYRFSYVLLIILWTSEKGYQLYQGILSGHNMPSPLAIFLFWIAIVGPALSCLRMENYRHKTNTNIKRNIWKDIFIWFLYTILLCICFIGFETYQDEEYMNDRQVTTFEHFEKWNVIIPIICQNFDVNIGDGIANRYLKLTGKSFEDELTSILSDAQIERLRSVIGQSLYVDVLNKLRLLSEDTGYPIQDICKIMRDSPELFDSLLH